VGRSAAWPARLIWDQENAGSSPAVPTKGQRRLPWPSCGVCARVSATLTGRPGAPGVCGPQVAPGRNRLKLLVATGSMRAEVRFTRVARDNGNPGVTWGLSSVGKSVRLKPGRSVSRTHQVPPRHDAGEPWNMAASDWGVSAAPGKPGGPAGTAEGRISCRPELAAAPWAPGLQAGPTRL
jgi:hypothetical protein